jgi:hypothetical protein
MSRIQILLGTFALYDTDWLPDITISGIGGKGWEWMVETVEPIRSVEIKTIDRAMASTDLRFTVSRQHAGHAEAVLFLMTYPLTVQRGGQVQIIATPDTGASTTFYLTQGQLQSVGEPSIIGCRTFHTLGLIGGRWVTNPRDLT